MAAVTNNTSNINNLYNTDTTTTKTQDAAGSTLGSADALASKSAFLTLLVAQLKNQDPSQPADGMQFVTQLAQFSNLEQSLAMRTDLDSINSKMTGPTLTSSVSPSQK